MPARRRIPRRLPDYPPKPGAGQFEDDSACGNAYQDVLGGADPATLDRMRRIKLQDEIVLLRVVMRKIALLATEQDSPLDAWLETMNSLSQAATRLARLLSVELTLTEGESDGLPLLSEAIHNMMKDTGW